MTDVMSLQFCWFLFPNGISVVTYGCDTNGEMIELSIMYTS